MQRGREDRQSAEKKAGDQEQVLRQDMYQGEKQDVSACSHPDESAAKTDGETFIPEDQGRQGAQIPAQQCREHEGEQGEVGEKRGEETLKEAGLCGGDPGEKQGGEGAGIFGGKAGAEKQTGEQAGQEEKKQYGSDFSHR